MWMTLQMPACLPENFCPDHGDPPHLNVGTGMDCTIRDLAMVAAAIGYPGSIDWDTSNRWHPEKAARRESLMSLGWRARIPLKEGLASTVALFREELRHESVRL